jgi:hypothetical protein
MKEASRTEKKAPKTKKKNKRKVLETNGTYQK